MATIKCPECGYEMNGNELNCPNCGCPFTEWTKQNNVPPYNIPPYNVNNIPNYAQTAIKGSQIKQKNNDSNRLAIAIVLSAIATALVVLCIFLFFPKKEDAENSEVLNAADQRNDSSIRSEDHDLLESESIPVHPETDYEDITEQKSEHDGITVYWFMPNGFTKAEDGMYYAPDYPNDSANINVIEAQDDQITFQYTKENFCDSVEYLYEQTYDCEVEVNCTEFTESELNGCKTLMIRASYNLLGMDIEQVQFAIEVEKDKVTTITYTQEAGGTWTDAFNSCIDSVRVENQQSSSNDDTSGELRSEVEITFRDLPWGTTFSEADSELSQLNLWNLSGEYYKQFSVDAILIGDYDGIDFEYSGINVISNSMNKEQDVAGYTTSDITLYFAFVPVDGYLTYNEDDAVLYGAQYEFEPTDLARMYEDLTQKLTGLYGEPYSVSEDTSIFGEKYTYTKWLGANDTELMLRAEDSSGDTTGLSTGDKIYISYAWRYGDVLLQNASDAIKREKLDAETDAQESGNTDGL